MLSITPNHKHQSKFITLCQDKTVFWVLKWACEINKLKEVWFNTPDCIKYFLFLLSRCIKDKVRVITEAKRLSIVGQWCQHCIVVFITSLIILMIMTFTSTTPPPSSITHCSSYLPFEGPFLHFSPPTLINVMG